MKEDATYAPAPLWVRLVRMMVCLIFAAVIGVRGVYYDPPNTSAAVPFFMCSVTAAYLAVIGVMMAVRKREFGPA